MVLTDRQRADLHVGIYEYLAAQPGEAFEQAAKAMAAADPDCVKAAADDKKKNGGSQPASSRAAATPLLEKKWTAIPRLQKKVLDLERQLQQQQSRGSLVMNGKAAAGAATSKRRLLPRLPCQYTLQGHQLGVTCVALHPALVTLVVSGSEDGTCRVWDHESGDYIRTLKGHTHSVTGLDFCPTGAYLASCSADLSIKLWDFTHLLQEGPSNGGHHQPNLCLRTLRGHDHTISAVRFLPRLDLLHNSSNSEQAPAQATAQSPSATASNTTTTGVVPTTAGCLHLLSASRDESVKLWDVTTGFCDATWRDHKDWVRCLAVQAASALWASSGNDKVICVYSNAATGSSGSEEVATSALVPHDATKAISVTELRGHEHVVETLAFVTEDILTPSNQPPGSRSSGGTAAREGSSSSKHMETIRDYLASGSRDRTVRLWKVSTASCLMVLTAHENWVRSVLIHPSGNYVISSSDDKSIRVFDIANQRCLRTLDKAHNHFVTALDMHATLPVLVSGSVDQTVRCWQLD